MTASASKRLELKASSEDHQIAKLAGLAIVLALIDTSLPSPLPGVKPGFANIITLLALEKLGLRAAIWVSLLRIMGTGLFLGSLFTPGFFLSLSGGIASLLGLTLTYRLPKRWFGPVTMSLCAAFCHILGQLLLARWILIPSNSIVYFLPAFAWAALLSGTANGLILASILNGKWPSFLNKSHET